MSEAGRPSQSPSLGVARRILAVLGVGLLAAASFVPWVAEVEDAEWNPDPTTFHPWETLGFPFLITGIAACFVRLRRPPEAPVSRVTAGLGLALVLALGLLLGTEYPLAAVPVVALLVAAWFDRRLGWAPPVTCSVGLVLAWSTPEIFMAANGEVGVVATAGMALGTVGTFALLAAVPWFRLAPRAAPGEPIPRREALSRLKEDLQGEDGWAP